MKQKHLTKKQLSQIKETMTKVKTMSSEEEQILMNDLGPKLDMINGNEQGTEEVFIETTFHHTI